MHAYKTRIMMMVLGLSMSLAGAANATSTQAYKFGFDFFSGELDHTYFCLDAGTACYSLPIYGFSTPRSGGTPVAGTLVGKSYHQRCLARARASTGASVCGAANNLYGIEGVCHQHTNKGQMSMHGTFMNPDRITGGWSSFVAYGPYGVTYAATCAPASTAQCAFSW